jgi:hypothetical protein
MLKLPACIPGTTGLHTWNREYWRQVQPEACKNSVIFPQRAKSLYGNAVARLGRPLDVPAVELRLQSSVTRL